MNLEAQSPHSPILQTGEDMFRHTFKAWMRELGLTQEKFVELSNKEVESLYQNHQIDAARAKRLMISQPTFSKIVNGQADHNKNLIIIWLRVFFSWIHSAEFADYVQRELQAGRRPTEFKDSDGRYLLTLAGYSTEDQVRSALTTAEQRAVLLTRAPKLPTTQQLRVASPRNARWRRSNDFEWNRLGTAVLVAGQGKEAGTEYLLVITYVNEPPGRYACYKCRRLLTNEYKVSFIPNRTHGEHEERHFCVHDTPIKVEVERD